MKYNQMFPSKYLKGADIIEEGGEVRVLIKSIVFEELQDPKTQKKEDKPVMYFVRQEKGLVLGKENGKRLVELFGDESDHWIGKTITLNTERVTAFGATTDAVRIKMIDENKSKSKQVVHEEPEPEPALEPEPDEVAP